MQNSFPCLCSTLYPRKSNSPSGTLQIRVFSSFTVSFSLPMISRRLSGWLDEQGRTWLQRRLALEDTRREHLSPGSALASLTDYRVLARVVMVDRRDRPGGHWNDAYPFVGLHQPAAFYGVASRELSEWKKDETGLNAGFYSLSTGTEVLNHFEQVMRQRFLPSGRVVFHPMTEYSEESGSHRLTSLTTGETRSVRTHKLVDATHARTEIPSTHPPRYEVAPGVALIPVNGLPNIRRPHSRYTVIGSGKTGMDACVWLLQNGVPPDRIRWIMPRDAWLLNRANFQPGAENFETSIGSMISQLEIIAEASSLSDLFHRLEAADLLLRIDPQVEPTCYRCAVVSREELRALRRIPDIVRLGRVRAVERSRLVLDRGELLAKPSGSSRRGSTDPRGTSPRQAAPKPKSACLNRPNREEPNYRAGSAAGRLRSTQKNWGVSVVSTLKPSSRAICSMVVFSRSTSP